MAVDPAAAARLSFHLFCRYVFGFARICLDSRQELAKNDPELMELSKTIKQTEKQLRNMARAKVEEMHPEAAELWARQEELRNQVKKKKAKE